MAVHRKLGRPWYEAVAVTNRETRREVKREHMRPPDHRAVDARVGRERDARKGRMMLADERAASLEDRVARLEEEVARLSREYPK